MDRQSVLSVGFVCLRRRLAGLDPVPPAVYDGSRQVRVSRRAGEQVRPGGYAAFLSGDAADGGGVNLDRDDSFARGFAQETVPAVAAVSRNTSALSDYDVRGGHAHSHAHGSSGGGGVSRQGPFIPPRQLEQQRYVPEMQEQLRMQSAATAARIQQQQQQQQQRQQQQQDQPLSAANLGAAAASGVVAGILGGK